MISKSSIKNLSKTIALPISKINLLYDVFRIESLATSTTIEKAKNIKISTKNKS